MKKKLLLFRCLVSFCFFDVLAAIFTEMTYKDLRRESKAIIKLIKVTLRTI